MRAVRGLHYGGLASRFEQVERMPYDAKTGTQSQPEVSSEKQRHDLLNDLKCCRDLQWGRTIHEKAVKTGNLDIYVLNALISMYRKCGSMVDARRMFDSIHRPTVVSWTNLVMGYAENGDEHTALDLFSKMKTGGWMPDSVTYIAALKACTYLAAKGDCVRKKDCLERGRRIHTEIGSHLKRNVQSSLMDMYANCGSMVDAREVFDSIEQPNVVHWNVLLLGYVEQGEALITLELFSKMKESGNIPDSVTYIAALKACTYLAINGNSNENWLQRGRKIHSEIGSHMDHKVESTLIEMYANCGSMADAHSVFDSIQQPNVVHWNTLISGYASNGQADIALELFSNLKKRGFIPSSVTYVAALKACTVYGEETALERGREIHLEVGTHLDRNVQSSLIDMYANCGSMLEARDMFDSIQRPNVVHWNTLILGYTENGEARKALDVFYGMKELGHFPSAVTFIAVLKACGSIGALVLGRKLHWEIREFTPHIVTCLVDFYARCGSMIEAREVFDEHSTLAKAVPTWNALMAGYGRFGDADPVFKLFDMMKDEGLRPDAITFVCMLLCCSHAGLVDKATECLDKMQCSFGLNPAIIHYNCVIDVLGRGNQLDKALRMMQKMPCSPNTVTWNTLLGACRKWKNVEIGRGAFQALIDIEKNDGFVYVIMADIYGSRDMWEEQKRVLVEGMSLKEKLKH